MSNSSGLHWDDGNWPKCGEHGVSKPEIEELFSGRPDVMPDLLHSALEPRQWAFGRLDSGRALFVVFTTRTTQSGLFIRPISARYMHEKEVRKYERTKGK